VPRPIDTDNPHSLQELLNELRSCVIRQTGGISCDELYQYCRSGTKDLIAEYYTEVCSVMKRLSKNEFGSAFNDQKKLAFFRQLRHAHGCTGLLLSGGAALGMYHLGIVKSLFENGLLPKVITGSSAGAIVGSLICSRTDDKLHELFEPDKLDFNVFENATGSRIEPRVKRFLSTGVLMVSLNMERIAPANRTFFVFVGHFEIESNCNTKHVFEENVFLTRQ
jgi:TAG lipase/lysophosphatidylethanolamine acyltransferase